MNDLTPVTAYLGLGSNLAEPIAQINDARLAINALDNIEECSFSSLYSSPPMGPQDQPDYVNAVMSISTTLPPITLLHSLQAIENEHGRVREQRWGARTLDLDILLYGDTQLNQPDLIIPHIGLGERAFVLYPLQEITADLIMPSGIPLNTLVSKCPLDGLKKL